MTYVNAGNSITVKSLFYVILVQNLLLLFQNETVKLVFLSNRRCRSNPNVINVSNGSMWGHQ